MLPDEVWIQTLLNISDVDLCHTSRVSVYFNKLYDNKYLWYQKIQNAYTRLEMKTFINYKELYFSMILNDRQCLLSYAKENRYFTLFIYIWMALEPSKNHVYYQKLYTCQQQEFNALVTQAYDYLNTFNTKIDENIIAQYHNHIRSLEYKYQQYNSSLIREVLHIIHDIEKRVNA